MSRTVLDIDRELLTAAKGVLAAASFTSAVNEALRRVVQEDRHQAAINLFASLSSDRTDVMRQARNEAW